MMVEESLLIYISFLIFHFDVREFIFIIHSVILSCILVFLN